MRSNASTASTASTASNAITDSSLLDEISCELSDIYDLRKKDWNFDSESNYEVIETIYLIMMSNNTKLKTKVREVVKNEMHEIVWCYWRNYIKYAENPPDYDHEYEIEKKESEFWSKLNQAFGRI